MRNVACILSFVAVCNQLLMVAVPGDQLSEVSAMEKVDFVMKAGAVYRRP